MKKRDYSEILRRIGRLKWKYSSVELIGEAYGESIYSVFLKSSSSSPIRVLIGAGIHGDEPAGVEAALRFLEKDNLDLLKDFEFLILPCINPYGYINDCRLNCESVDINRSFHNDSSIEAAIVKEALKESYFDFFIDLHEDCEYNGFYLFEGTRRKNPLGKDIIGSISEIGEINNDEIIDGFIASGGVISFDLDEDTFGHKIMGLYLSRKHTNHMIICETPISWDFDKRVESHLSALDTALEKFY